MRNSPLNLASYFSHVFNILITLGICPLVPTLHHANRVTQAL
jgi:hypothetical protein